MILNKNFSKIIDKIRWYGLLGSFNLAIDLVITKIIYRNARLIRQPCYIRAPSKFRFPRGFTSGVGFRLDIFNGGILRLGSDIQINDYVHIGIMEHVEIGSNTLIASKVFISDHNHGQYFVNDLSSSSSQTPPLQRKLFSKKVLIGKNVWIGENVSILPGVVIGDGSVIGANSVVTKEVPANSIAVGNPARVIRVFDVESSLWRLF